MFSCHAHYKCCYCSIVSHTYILSILLCLEQILFELCLYLDLAKKTRMIYTINWPWYIDICLFHVVILSTLLLNSFTKMSFIYNIVNLWCVCLFLFKNADKILENNTALSNGKGSNADKVQDSETSLLVSKKADKNYLDTVMESISPVLM